MNNFKKVKHHHQDDFHLDDHSNYYNLQSCSSSSVSTINNTSAVGGEAVTITLLCGAYGGPCQSMLARKFSNQQKGRVKWLKDKEEFHKESKQTEDSKSERHSKRNNLNNYQGFPFDFIGVIEAMRSEVQNVAGFPVEFIRDKETVVHISNNFGSKYETIPSCWRIPEVIVAVLRSDTDAHNYITSLDNETALQILKHNGLFLGLARNWNDGFGNNFGGDKELVLQAVKQNGGALSFVNDTLKNDEQVVLEAVKQNSTSLYHASKTLKSNEAIVMEAVRQHGPSIRFASFELKNNYNIVSVAIEEDGSSLKYASPYLRNSKEMVLKAVKQSKYALQYASPELQNDKEVIELANKNIDQILHNIVTHDMRNITKKTSSNDYKKQHKLRREERMERDNTYSNFALQILSKIETDPSFFLNASDALRNDKNFVMRAADINLKIIEYASIELRSDPNFVLDLASKNDRLFRDHSNCVNESLKGDKNFVILALRFGFSFNDASIELKQNKEFIIEAVKLCPPSLSFISEELKNDKEFILEIVGLCGLAIYFTSFNNDIDVVLKAVKQDYEYFKLASKEIRDNKEMVMKLVKENGLVLEYVSRELRDDREIVLEAVKQNGLSLRFASESLRGDRDIVNEAVKQNGLAFYLYSTLYSIDNTSLLNEMYNMKMDASYWGCYNFDQKELDDSKGIQCSSCSKMWIPPRN